MEHVAKHWTTNVEDAFLLARHIAFAYASRQADDSQRYTLEDYMNAPSHGPLHATWEDKPHRLIYDLVKRVREAQAGGLVL